MDIFQPEYDQPKSSSYDECSLPSEVLTNTLAEFVDVLKLPAISQSLRTYGVSISLIEDYFNEWDGHVRTWLVEISLKPKDWALLDEQRRDSIETSLTKFVNSIEAVKSPDNFEVRLAVRLVNSSQNITNQGRAYSSNPASIQDNGLFFRSQPEVWLFAALRDTGLPVMPLPVVISNKLHFRRIEPDFVVIRRGMTFVIEVDGDRWHQETPAKAQERLRHLEDEGVRVIRVSAEKCNSPESAKETAKDVLRRIERFLESR